MAAGSTPQINILPENVVHKIAAGEVVERPVSVVKELVENAIDAGATQIQVDVVKGGIESIIITDNGHGIPPEQMPLALTRHATSKIARVEDLFSLHTMGFRGEALPSIASISQFRLESATSESEPVGYVLEVKEGKQGTLKETGMPRGTRIVVGKLFCTTPARLKFLKRPETEWGHIADLLTALALGHLHIEWKVTHNGKKFLFCPPAADPKQRILDLFGKDAFANLYPVDRSVSEVGLQGLISHPNFCKKSNRHMFVYVNGRYVQDRLLNHAIVNGYRSLLMTKQYPMVVLHVGIDPALVDVNVHPAKREIKFSNGNAIHHLVSETLHQALEAAPWQDAQIQENSELLERKVVGGFSGTQATLDEVVTALPRPSFDKNTDPLGGVRQALESYSSRQGLETAAPQALEARIGTLAFSNLQLIGQFSSTYLVCEQEGSLFLIDQHAAHERIGFEKLRQSYQKSDLARQALLKPVTFSLSPNGTERLKGCLSELEKFGLEVDEFGDNTFVIKSHPTLLKNCDAVALINDLVDQMVPEAPVKVLEDRIDHVLATMACHRQIRANHRLNREEMVELLKQLEGTPRSYHCPHGRPVMVEIPAREIEKWFKRVL